MVIRPSNHQEFQAKFIAEQLRVLAECVEEEGLLDYEENFTTSFDDIPIREFYFEVDAKQFHCLKNSICTMCGTDFYHTSEDESYCPKCESK